MVAQDDGQRKILNIRVDRILVDPEVPNIRGPIRDTTDLQQSIRRNGIQNPLWVRPADDRPDYFYLIDGGRRHVAAGVLDLKEVPCEIKHITASEVRDLMLVASVRQPLSPIVLSPSGEVIGGYAYAVYHEVEAGRRRVDIATSMGNGATADVVGAYYRLYRELPAVQRKVASGQMAITVYSLIKTQSTQLKEYVAEKTGTVTADWVRDTIKRWSDIKEDLDGRASEVESDGNDEIEVVEASSPTPMDMEELVKPAAMINTALAALRSIRGKQLTVSEYWLVEEVYNLSKEIMGNG